MASLQLRRVYQAPGASDGTRILVDRLWPRGVAKGKGRHRPLAQGPSRRATRCASGFMEAAGLGCVLRRLCGGARERGRAGGGSGVARTWKEGPLTLLYAARDEAHNNAVALKAWLEPGGSLSPMISADRLES